MIEVFDMARGTGKTTKVIEMLENDPELFCLVPFRNFGDHYPDHLRKRLLFTEDFLRFKSFEGRKVSRIVLDEGFLYKKSKLAELYYTLGQMNIAVFSFGTSD